MRSIVRTLSLLSISLSVLLGSLVRNTEITFPEPEGTVHSLELSYSDTILKRDVPPIDDSISSLFLHPITGRFVKPPEKQITVPDLTFIGIVETEQKQIFSFKNRSTHKLILLEKGTETGGLTLIDDTAAACTLKISGHVFKVGK